MMKHTRERNILTLFLVLGILLPVGSMFLFSFARILAFFGDPMSRSILDCAAILFFILWIVNFFALALVLAARILYGEENSSRDRF